MAPETPCSSESKFGQASIFHQLLPMAASWPNQATMQLYHKNSRDSVSVLLHTPETGWSKLAAEQVCIFNIGGRGTPLPNPFNTTGGIPPLRESTHTTV